MRVAADTGRPALSARRLTVRIYLTDVLRRRLRIRNLALDRARIRLRASDGSWGLPLRAAPAPRAAGAPSAPPPFTLDAGHARRATLRLEPRGGGASLVRIRRLDFQGALAASGVARGTVRLRGHLDRATVVFGGSFRRARSAERVRAEFAAAHVDVGRTLHLVPVGTASREVAGVVDLQLEYHARRRGEQAERRFGGKVRADDLAVGEIGAARHSPALAGAPAVRCPRHVVRGAARETRPPAARSLAHPRCGGCYPAGRFQARGIGLPPGGEPRRLACHRDGCGDRRRRRALHRCAPRRADARARGRARDAGRRRRGGYPRAVLVDRGARDGWTGRGERRPRA